MEQKNLLMAIVLSVAIMLGWQFYIEQTTPPPSDKTAEQTGSPVAPGNSAGGSTGSALTPPAPGTPDQAAKLPSQLIEQVNRRAAQALPRVKIISPRVTGSLSLVGARFDDLTLEDYRESIEPDSEKVTLLKPFGTDNAYYAYYGWVSTDTQVPPLDARWTADREELGPGSPVTLSWTNKDGVICENFKNHSVASKFRLGVCVLASKIDQK